MERVPEDATLTTHQTIGVGRVLQRAVLHVQGPASARSPEPTCLWRSSPSPSRTLCTCCSSTGSPGATSRCSSRTGSPKTAAGRWCAGPPEAVGIRRWRSTEEADGGDVADDPLTAYAVDLKVKAEAGRIEPLIGRHAEVTRVVQVLCRRRKNNPVLVGEPGVGKTAIVEGLALRIHEKKGARGHQGRAHLLAGHGLGPGRHQVPRPVRRAAQGGHRRHR